MLITVGFEKTCPAGLDIQTTQIKKFKYPILTGLKLLAPKNLSTTQWANG